MTTPRQLLRTAVTSSGISAGQLLELLQTKGILPNTAPSFFKNMLTPNHPTAKVDINLCPVIQETCGQHHVFYSCAKRLGYIVELEQEKGGWMPIANRYLEVEKCKGAFLQAAADEADPAQVQELGQKLKASVDEFVSQYAAELSDGSRIRLHKGGDVEVNTDRLKKKKSRWKFWEK